MACENCINCFVCMGIPMKPRGVTDERFPDLQVRTMHALDSPNILKFYAWYETTNHLWLILEFCVGGDLMSLISQACASPHLIPERGACCAREQFVQTRLLRLQN